MCKWTWQPAFTVTRSNTLDIFAICGTPPGFAAIRRCPRTRPNRYLASPRNVAQDGLNRRRLTWCLAVDRTPDGIGSLEPEFLRNIHLSTKHAKHVHTHTSCLLAAPGWFRVRAGYPLFPHPLPFPAGTGLSCESSSFSGASYRVGFNGELRRGSRVGSLRIPLISPVTSRALSQTNRILLCCCSVRRTLNGVNGVKRLPAKCRVRPLLENKLLPKRSCHRRLRCACSTGAHWEGEEQRDQERSLRI